MLPHMAIPNSGVAAVRKWCVSRTRLESCLIVGFAVGFVVYNRPTAADVHKTIVRTAKPIVYSVVFVLDELWQATINKIWRTFAFKWHSTIDISVGRAPELDTERVGYFRYLGSGFYRHVGGEVVKVSLTTGYQQSNGTDGIAFEFSQDDKTYTVESGCLTRSICGESKLTHHAPRPCQLGKGEVVILDENYRHICGGFILQDDRSDQVLLITSRHGSWSHTNYVVVGKQSNTVSVPVAAALKVSDIRDDVPVGDWDETKDTCTWKDILVFPLSKSICANLGVKPLTNRDLEREYENVSATLSFCLNDTRTIGCYTGTIPAVPRNSRGRAFMHQTGTALIKVNSQAGASGCLVRTADSDGAALGMLLGQPADDYARARGMYNMMMHTDCIMSTLHALGLWKDTLANSVDDYIASLVATVTPGETKSQTRPFYGVGRRRKQKRKYEEGQALEPLDYATTRQDERQEFRRDFEEWAENVGLPGQVSLIKKQKRADFGESVKVEKRSDSDELVEIEEVSTVEETLIKGSNSNRASPIPATPSNSSTARRRNKKKKDVSEAVDDNPEKAPCPGHMREVDCAFKNAKHGSHGKPPLVQQKMKEMSGDIRVRPPVPQKPGESVSLGQQAFEVALDHERLAWDNKIGEWKLKIMKGDYEQVLEEMHNKYNTCECAHTRANLAQTLATPEFGAYTAYLDQVVPLFDGDVFDGVVNQVDISCDEIEAERHRVRECDEVAEGLDSYYCVPRKENYNFLDANGNTYFKSVGRMWARKMSMKKAKSAGPKSKATSEALLDLIAKYRKEGKYGVGKGPYIVPENTQENILASMKAQASRVDARPIVLHGQDSIDFSTAVGSASTVYHEGLVGAGFDDGVTPYVSEGADGFMKALLNLEDKSSGISSQYREKTKAAWARDHAAELVDFACCRLILLGLAHSHVRSFTANEHVKFGLSDVKELHIKGEGHPQAKMNDERYRLIWVNSLIDIMIQCLLHKADNNAMIAAYDCGAFNWGALSIGHDDNGIRRFCAAATSLGLVEENVSSDLSSFDLTVPAELIYADGRRRADNVPSHLPFTARQIDYYSYVLSKHLCSAQGIIFQVCKLGVTSSGALSTTAQNTHGRTVVNFFCGSRKHISTGDDTVADKRYRPERARKLGMIPRDVQENRGCADFTSHMIDFETKTAQFQNVEKMLYHLSETALLGDNSMPERFGGCLSVVRNTDEVRADLLEIAVKHNDGDADGVTMYIDDSRFSSGIM